MEFFKFTAVIFHFKGKFPDFIFQKIANILEDKFYSIILSLRDIRIAFHFQYYSMYIFGILFPRLINDFQA